jgi:hypothetical protein
MEELALSYKAILFIAKLYCEANATIPTPIHRPVSNGLPVVGL